MSRASAASIVIVAGMALAASVQAAQPRSVDARTLDIAGVRTGMSYDEALAAAASHFKVAPGQFKPDPLPSENPVTHTKLPDYFTYEQGGMRFAVYFEGRVPVDKRRPLAVSMVRYELPWSQQNSQAMAEADDPTKNIGIRLVFWTAKDVQYQNILGLNVLTIRIGGTKA